MFEIPPKPMTKHEYTDGTIYHDSGKLEAWGMAGWQTAMALSARVAELEQEVADHQSIEKGHLYLIAELKSRLKLKN